MFYASLMALSFGLAQVFSRKLRNLDISLTNAFTGLFGFTILLIDLSHFIEGETVSNIKSINLNSWIIDISYPIVSLYAHLLMFSHLAYVLFV